MFEIKNEDIASLNKIENLSSEKRKAYILNVYYCPIFASLDKRICCELYDIGKEYVIATASLDIGTLIDQQNRFFSKQLYKIFKEKIEDFFNKILKRHFVFLNICLRVPVPEINCFFYLPIQHDFNNELFKKFELLLTNIEKDIKNMEDSNDRSQ